MSSDPRHILGRLGEQRALEHLERLGYTLVARNHRTRFGEIDQAAGILGHLRGPDLMPVLLNGADRPLFAGSRPTPFRHAQGYPSELEPL